MVRLQVITISDFVENNITMQCLELSNNMLQELIRAKKWHDTTKCIEQKSFTDHEPKRTRRYDGTHVNMALMQNASKNQANTSKQGCNMII